MRHIQTIFDQPICQNFSSNQNETKQASWLLQIFANKTKVIKKKKKAETTQTQAVDLNESKLIPCSNMNPF